MEKEHQHIKSVCQEPKEGEEGKLLLLNENERKLEWMKDIKTEKSIGNVKMMIKSLQFFFNKVLMDG